MDFRTASLRKLPSWAAALPIAAALLFSAPLSAGKPVTVLLNGVTATGSSLSVDVNAARPEDFLTLQATYPTGVTLTLDHSLDGSTWDTLQTWSASGKSYTAPCTGAIYRVNVSAYAGVIAQTTGSGLSDITLGGTYSGGVAGQTFTVEITSAATPDVFRWKEGSGSWTTGVNVTGLAQTLAHGVSVTFAATTGHTLGDVWTATFGGVYVRAVASGTAQILTY